MRNRSRFIAFLGLIIFPTIVPAQSGPSVWDLNGSQMFLSAHGARRVIRYHTARPGLQDAGVQPGTLWFEGTRNGDQYSGTAYVFSPACGPVPYPVSGSVSPDGNTITIYGAAPIVTPDGCAIVDRHDTTDALHLIEQATTPRPSGQTQTYGDDGRSFSSGKDDYFLLSRTPSADENEEVSGYAGQVRVVHHFDGGGYEILLKDYSVACHAEENAPTVVWYKAGDHADPITVIIRSPERSPRASDKESYNLYWAACFGKFHKFK